MDHADVETCASRDGIIVCGRQVQDELRETPHHRDSLRAKVSANTRLQRLIPSRGTEPATDNDICHSHAMVAFLITSSGKTAEISTPANALISLFLHVDSSGAKMPEASIRRWGGGRR
ncbi:hypothetical protein BS329_01835 [Amycolatopsis coloradensis]|uniref:Uncharacterized protein n=1 Tax=Amycolatopsis coloradensis TaxID=76021 RepID=A0A1R0L414_9PSEU|nr:hypothetical protein [Amycolatopsis coloradensis]OLZ57428.1 hypothetical protein BS329_01835 [Amycolatopsis coloradensis]